MVVNFSYREIKLPKATVLGIAEETSASIMAAINDEELLDPSCSEKIRWGVNTVLHFIVH
jgi:hypothetical protein